MYKPMSAAVAAAAAATAAAAAAAAAAKPQVILSRSQSPDGPSLGTGAKQDPNRNEAAINLIESR